MNSFLFVENLYLCVENTNADQNWGKLSDEDATTNPDEAPSPHPYRAERQELSAPILLVEPADTAASAS